MCGVAVDVDKCRKIVGKKRREIVMLVLINKILSVKIFIDVFIDELGFVWTFGTGSHGELGYPLCTICNLLLHIIFFSCRPRNTRVGNESQALKCLYIRKYKSRRLLKLNQHHIKIKY